MESFIPGQAYGYAYDYFIWVCQNPVERSFEKCSLAQSTQVYEALVSRLQSSGLGQKCFVFRSGCLLGCCDGGTTLAITRRLPDEKGSQNMTFLRHVTVNDVPEILTLLQNLPSSGR